MAIKTKIVDGVKYQIVYVVKGDYTDTCPICGLLDKSTIRCFHNCPGFGYYLRRIKC